MEATSPSDLQALAVQLAWQKRLTATAMSLAAAALMLTAVAQLLHWGARTRTLSADEFVIEDALNGTKRVRLAEQGLSLIDKDGSLRLGMNVGHEGAPAFTLFDTKGKVRAVISAGAEGSPGITLHDSTGRMRTRMSIGPDDVPALTFYDSTGKIVAQLPEKPPAAPAKSETIVPKPPKRPARKTP